MPVRAKHPCNQPGCGRLTDSTYCPEHTAQQATRETQRKAQVDRYRGNSAARGYDARWRAYRKTYLANNPLCVECLKADRTTAAIIVDHIKPHKGDMAVFWDTENHQALCKPCHDSKTAREDGGFGNRQAASSQSR
jgi:5-methylcytosine-specific restriction enzyme A